MKILMSLFNTIGKGTYWRALYFGRALANMGHEVTVLATSPHNHLHFSIKPDAKSSVTIVEAPDMLSGALRSGWDMWNVLARIHWVRQQNFDLVHAFESRPTALYPALYVKKHQQAKLILDWCDWFGKGGSIEERPNPMVRALLRPVETFYETHFRPYADGTTVINSELRRKAISLGIAPETIFHLPNGCDVDTLHPIAQHEARKALNLSEHDLILGYIGAIFRRDANLMAAAFDRIHQAEPRAKLLLAGYCNVAIEELVSAPQAIIRTGHIQYNEISLYLSASDLCWLPLRDSGANRGRFPLKLNDYMAVGCPVVATSVGDIPDVIQRGNFGVLAEDQPEALAQQTLKLLHDPIQRQEMGLRARQFAVAHFTWDDLGEKLARFYEQIMEAR